MSNYSKTTGAYNQNRGATFSNIGNEAKARRGTSFGNTGFERSTNKKTKERKLKSSFDLGLSDRVPDGETRSLFDFARIGDPVLYDAGKWSSEEISLLATEELYGGMYPIPSTFFGFKAGTNKNYNVEKYKYLSNQWRVMIKTYDGEGNKFVVLIHSGISELFEVLEDFTELEEAIEKRDWTAYVNFDYATIATPLTSKVLEEWLSITKKTNSRLALNDNVLDEHNLFAIGIPYWLCKKFGKEYGFIINEEGLYTTALPNILGIRMVVGLSNDIQTVGKDSNGAWELVPVKK